MKTRKTYLNSKKISLANQAGIHFPTILPLFDSPPDLQAAQNWINGHQQSPLLRSCAEKIVTNLNYIPFDSFLNQLQASIQDFNQRMKKPYVLWVAQSEAVAEVGCSDYWVAGLALEYGGLACPAAIVNTAQLTIFLEQNPEIRDILILDDAAYGCNHLMDQLHHAEMLCIKKQNNYYEMPLRSYHLHVLVPFMTVEATRKLQQQNYFPETTIYPNTELKVVKDFLNETELAALGCNRKHIEGKTLTYFDHRFPDCWSSLTYNLYDGDHLLSILDLMPQLGYRAPYMEFSESTELISDPEAWNALVEKLRPKPIPIVPKIIPPYRLHRKEGYFALEKVLSENRFFGQRNSNPVPNHYRELAEILTAKGLDSAPEKKLAASCLGKQGFFKPSLIAVGMLGAAALLLDLSIQKFKFNN